MRSHHLLLAILLATAVSADAQRPGAYFSLSTSKAFLPGEKVTIRLYARDVEALEFRVYKVNDPARFFQQLDDAHNFGRVNPKEAIDKPTLLERFHDWKHRLWVRIRDFFRRQFSGAARAEIRGAQGQARKSNVVASTVFAQVPLLNSKQMVARWRQEMPLRYFAESQDVPINPAGKGVFLVEATDGTLRAYTIVIVSELGIITKSAPGQLLTFAADRRSGAPTANVNILVLAGKKESGKGVSDSNGLAMVSLPQGQYEDVRVFAAHGDDVAVVAPYSFNVSSSPEEDWSGYIYTDRPVYRPGHTVHFKGVLRTRSGEHYTVPAGQQVQVVIEDSNSKHVLQKKLTLSTFGSVHADFEVPDNAALGYYSISISSAGEARYGMTGGFNVEEYKKPEYEVKVTPDQPRVRQGDTISATIEAKYYFGEPVAGAEVKYVVHISPYWSPYIERDDDGDAGSAAMGEGEGADGDNGYDYAGDQVSEQSGKLGADGKLHITLPTRIAQHHLDTRYRVEARVTDAAHREVEGHNNVIATYGSFAVGIHAQSYVYEKGEKITAIAVAKDYDGHPVQAAVRVELVRSRYYYANQGETVVESHNAQTGADGSAELTFTAQDSGSFELRVKAQTPEHREVTGNSWVWISGREAAAWGGQERQIRMVADKKSYRVGDTAHLLVMTGTPDAYILLTTEGRTLQSQRIVRATAPSITVEVPIRSENEPNVYVSATFLRDDKLFQASKNLKVPAVQQKLQVEIEPSKLQFQPGEKAAYTITARDADGKPVTGEFSIGVVDEAIYAIRPDATPEPQDFFYGAVYNRVTTDSSLGFYFSGEAGNKAMFLAGDGARYSNLHALAQLKPETMVQPKIRKAFPDTALWLAEVHTDASGHARAELSFSDSLTTWRATVRGVTADTKVGSAINRVVVRKNLMVRLAVPRFFRQGDEVTVSSIVHNYLPTAKAVQVSLELKGLDVVSGASQSVNVPSRGEATVDWRLRAGSVRAATLLTKALTNEESDAVELTLPVIPFGVKLTEAKSGALVGAAQQETTSVMLPGDPLQAAPTLDIAVSPSIAGSIFGALDYLTSYPYGCTEQTMSSFLPNIVVAKAMQDLDLKAAVNKSDLDKKVSAGMERLREYQHSDGGWGWWKDDESQVFMTAYVVSGFAQAKAAGYGVDQASLAHAEQWLQSSLHQHTNMRSDLRAFVVYALALNQASSPEHLDSAWKDADGMSAQGLAMLGLALDSAGDSARAKEVATKLEKLAVVTDAEAYWPSKYDSLMEFEIDDQAETTAYAVRLLSKVRPDSALLPKAAFWLVSHRNGGYFWDSTKQTAMVVFGLTEYMKVSHELDADFTAEVSVNGRPVLSHHFAKAETMNPVQPNLHLGPDQLQVGKNEISIRKTGAGRLYWAASGQYYSTEKRLFQNNKLSLNITRDYFRMVPEQVNEKIVYRLEALSGELHSGDLIAVRVTVGGGEWRYLLVEDPIPAGAESVRRDDLYELQTTPPWWEFAYARREFHDDRTAFFQDYFKDRSQYVYLLKIVNPGTFKVSPAMVQPMYQPSVMSTTDATILEVK